MAKTRKQKVTTFTEQKVHDQESKDKIRKVVNDYFDSTLEELVSLYEVEQVVPVENDKPNAAFMKGKAITFTDGARKAKLGLLLFMASLRKDPTPEEDLETTEAMTDSIEQRANEILEARKKGKREPTE